MEFQDEVEEEEMSGKFKIEEDWINAPEFLELSFKDSCTFKTFLGEEL